MVLVMVTAHSQLTLLEHAQGSFCVYMNIAVLIQALHYLEFMRSYTLLLLRAQQVPRPFQIFV